MAASSTGRPPEVEQMATPQEKGANEEALARMLASTDATGLPLKKEKEKEKKKKNKEKLQAKIRKAQTKVRKVYEEGERDEEHPGELQAKIGKVKEKFRKLDGWMDTQCHELDEMDTYMHVHGGTSTGYN